MRPGFLIFALLLAGCWTTKKPEPIPAQPPAPTSQTTLLEVWQKEVADNLAIYTAIRPSLSGPPPALNLYDSATQGLASLSGSPTVPDVERFKTLVAKPDDKALSAIRAEKVALDKKTSELEAKAKAEELARIKAEAKAEQAEKAKSLAESAKTLTEYGSYTIAAGVLALLFGSWLGIQKWVAGLTIGAGVLVAATARPLIDFFGSDKSEWVLFGTLTFLALNLAVVVCIKTWYMIRKEKHPKP
jgi:hypothetical protein